MSITKDFEKRSRIHLDVYGPSGPVQEELYDPDMTDKLLAHARALEEKLKCLEWLGDDEGNMGTCPICGTAEFQGHSPDCQLNRLLEGVE